MYVGAAIPVIGHPQPQVMPRLRFQLLANTGLVIPVHVLSRPCVYVAV